MRISDWSSDVCSSDLLEVQVFQASRAADVPWVWNDKTPCFMQLGKVFPFLGSGRRGGHRRSRGNGRCGAATSYKRCRAGAKIQAQRAEFSCRTDRKSTRLNSSH